MAQKYVGKCTECGEDNIEVTLIDEVTSLCEDCIDELGYLECDECHEFWLSDVVDFEELDDGRYVCEYCAEDID